MTKSIVKNLVIGFGFLNGVWFSIGINPEDEIITFIQPILSKLHPWINILFIILPGLLLIGTFYTLFSIYKKGGIFGSLAVLIAFIAGAIILTNYILTIILLIISLIIGKIAFKK
ncbi:MAG: hypothetical protein KatS3mg002_1428 [Candidatus Woesearchaeota archaeon]|nr:MAG: hypothetical protein KatS3mg002_1428 [Candidatus Woesearchaeota archaeon]